MEDYMKKRLMNTSETPFLLTARSGPTKIIARYRVEIIW